MKILTRIVSWNEVAETTWITFAFANAILADSPPAEKAANEHAQHEILYCCNIARNGQVLDMLRNSDNLRICACLVQCITFWQTGPKLKAGSTQVS